ncbi:uncharacterized protein LOC132760576 [Ruditapes philippinarum]|uniref:uncharacterized protein LOC132760576 n=1 Tax=Ruditapes philippinarum TaxID=129788 RepID=UPI00295A837A|nr:uncharacterized protein LOC132760576 [Ruditapes philippinarum]
MKTLLIVLVCTSTAIGSVINGPGDSKRFLSSTVCSDTVDNCQAYGQTTCTNAVYHQWAIQNCAKTCNLCPVGTGTGSNGGGTTSGSSLGCSYNGQTYHQGQTWKVGCTLKCHCLSDFSGQYTCNEFCLQWKLPTQCHMQPPIRGKCCPTPYCPDGFIINFPPDYVAE